MKQETKNKKHLDRTALSKYFSLDTRGPIYRVAPCIEAMNDKLEVVQLCCGYLSHDPDEGFDFSDVMQGVQDILCDVQSELYEAVKVQRGWLADNGSTSAK